MKLQIPDNIQQSRVVILDCDDVAVDYVPALRLHAQKFFGMNLDPAGPKDWSMQDWFGTDDTQRIIDIVLHFNDGDEGDFHRIPARGGAKDLIKAIHASGRTIDMVTSSTVRPKSISRRNDNLVHLFGEGAISNIHFLAIGETKESILSTYEPSLFIDDNPGHVATGIDCGHFGMLLKTSSNESLHLGDGTTQHGHPFLTTLYDAIRIVEDLPVLTLKDHALPNLDF